MTDYFALLEQPRRPWLDAENLKQAFHSKALHVHPDARFEQSGATSPNEEFVQLNDGYQVLQEPKRRLHHLLSLAGSAPTKAPATIPRQIEELFPTVAAVTHLSDALVQKSRSATNALSRSLLKPELLDASREISAVLARIATLHAEAMVALEAVDRTWSNERPDLTELQRLYLEFSYLGRWKTELAEKQTELATC